MASWRRACLCSVKAAAGWELSPGGWGVSGWRPAAGSPATRRRSAGGRDSPLLSLPELGRALRAPAGYPRSPEPPGTFLGILGLLLLQLLASCNLSSPCHSLLLRALRGGEQALPSRSSQPHTPCPSSTGESWGKGTGTFP